MYVCTKSKIKSKEEASFWDLRFPLPLTCGMKAAREQLKVFSIARLSCSR